MRTVVQAVVLGIVVVGVACMGPAAGEGLLAGVSRVSITPLEEKIPTPLGGYGDRAGKPAEGIHDTIYAKVLILESGGTKVALITADVCSVPICVVAESLEKAGVEGLTTDNVVMAASHSHAGLEGYALDRRNIANNPYIGIFSEDLLGFVTDRVASAIQAADKALQPVVAASAATSLAGENANRRRDEFVDDGLTVLRLDDLQGNPYVVVVNFTAHGTIMTPKEMLISGGWAGNMQRTVEALMGDGVTCMYTNGAEGDIRPSSARGGSRWEMAEDYGRRIGIHAARLAGTARPQPVKHFVFQSKRVQLPPPVASPDFLKIAGDEYHVDEAMLDTLLTLMFPSEAPIYALRINDFQMASFPGEAICQLGLSVKDAMRSQGLTHPCVVGLATDSVGYILTADEYDESGYEVTASFYGKGLGQLMLDEVTALAVAVAKSGGE